MALPDRLKFVLRVIAGFSIFLFGYSPLLGFQGLFPALHHRGVFHDLCGPNVTLATTCTAQHARIAEVGNVSLALMNATSLISGILISVFGGWICGLAGMVWWSTSVAISGIQPTVGWWWATGAVGTLLGCGMIYLSLVGFFFAKTFPDPKVLSVVLSAVAGLQDVGVMGSIALGLIFKIDAIPLWLLYLGYALVVGVPSIIAMLTLWKRDDSQESGSPKTASDDDVVSMRTIVEADGEQLHLVDDTSVAGSQAVTLRGKVMETYHIVRHFFKRLLFWSLITRGFAVIAVGYLFLANIRPLVEYANGDHPVTDACVDRAITICTFMVGGIGAINSLWVSALCRWVGGQRASIIGSTVGSMCALVALVIFMSPGALVTSATPGTTSCVGPWFFVGFFFLLQFRVCTFAMINIVVPVTLIPNEPESYGVCFGTIYGIGGTLSAIIGGPLTGMLHSYPSSAVAPFVCMSLLGIACVELWAVYCIRREERKRVHQRASGVSYTEGVGF